MDIKPMKSVIPMTAQKEHDLELRTAIAKAIYMCGKSGEDATMIEIEVLRQMGRYDLLPQCERKCYI
jgi:hypothetical protein